jgi:hypothetical protein
MNPTGKKFISLFLIFSLVMLSMNLYAKERRGAKLLITKKDYQQIEGELITVKPNSLLLLDAEGKDVSIDIADIKVIRIVKKSKVLQGLGFGLLIGAGFSVLTGLTYEKDPLGYIATEGKALRIIWWGAFFGPLGLLIGGICGVAAGIDKTIQIEGMYDLEIKESLDYLRKKARIRDYK